MFIFKSSISHKHNRFSPFFDSINMVHILYVVVTKFHLKIEWMWAKTPMIIFIFIIIIMDDIRLILLLCAYIIGFSYTKSDNFLTTNVLNRKLTQLKTKTNHCRKFSLYVCTRIWYNWMRQTEWIHERNETKRNECNVIHIMWDFIRQSTNMKWIFMFAGGY